ncbi:hypothetical protein FB004_11933 [Sinorhizobium medicae]|uniref:hypothetical protein n=1 Tax=Sinorhizobium medicae TaxID=110321 RepID=UPI00119F36BB|nr:hypothetical protein [Sinorhizobium medicae]TWA15952.1 hypothetical protein FB004_11933 [Sinorhizobium medicae]
MSESGLTCSCLADTHGLLEIATQTSGNLKASLLDQVSSGVIGIPALVWQEFKDLYPEQAAALESHIPSTIRMSKRAYTAKAGRIAEKLNSGFVQGPYESGIEIQVAAIASVENCLVLTSEQQLARYKKMACGATDLDSWLKK